MKISLATATIFLVYATIVAGKPHHDLPPELKAVHDACLKKLGTTNDELFKSKRNGDFEKRDCFGACVAKESGVMTADGNWDKEKIATSLPPHVSQDIVKKIVDTCSEKKGADECETAAIFGKCRKDLIPHPPPSPEQQKMFEDCKKELHLSDEDVHEYMKSKESTDAGCFLACLDRRTEFVTADGGLNKDKILATLPPHVTKEAAEKAIAECGDKKGADDCETTIVRHKCFKEHGVFFGRRHGPPPPPPEM